MENQEKQNISEPNFKIFNEEMGSKNTKEESNTKERDEVGNNHFRDHSHRNRGGGIFGLIILFLGILLLLNNLGLVSKSIWLYLLPFWPVILILMGIKIILGGSRIARAVSFIIALIVLSFIFMNAWVSINQRYPSPIYAPRDFINFY
jgi:hypothetical protein